MKNYLLVLKKLLSKETGKRLEDNIEVNDDLDALVVDVREKEKVANFIARTGLKCNDLNLIRVVKAGTNAFEIRDNLIFFYPPNDGMPSCPFEFYQDGKKVIDNRNSFIQISNLDEILIRMTKIMSHGLDEYMIINPYDFMLELDGTVEEAYHGSAKLVITDKTIKNADVDPEHFDDARVYFINTFLDHFIGWNFGLSVNRNDRLKDELDKLNKKVIKLGIREEAGPGFEVFTSGEGVENYTFSTGGKSFEKEQK